MATAPKIKMSPAALARAIVMLRAQGDHASADFLRAHLPPAHGPLPGLDAASAGQPPSPNEPPDPSGLNSAGGMPKQVPHPDNPNSAGSLPPRFTKGFDPSSPLDWLTNHPADSSYDAPRSFPVAEAPSPNETPEHKFGCVLLPLPAPLRDRVLSLGRMIPDYDLADDGREDRPHVTALYGLHDADPGPVYDILSRFRPANIRLGNVSVFPGAEYDVVKVNVESDALHRMNAALRSLPHTNKFRDYIPHVTIAYVRPGLGAVYAARFGNLDAKCCAGTAVFSDRDKNRHMIPLGRTVTVEKAAMSYLNGGSGGSLVAPAGGGKRRVKLKRNKLVQMCKDALAEIGGDYEPVSLGKEEPRTPEGFDSVAFVFGDAG